MRAVLIAALLLIPGMPLVGAADLALSSGFDHFYNLEHDQALVDFTSETAAHPQDPSAWNHLAQGILYRAMFHNGALETELFGGTSPFYHRQKLNLPADEEQQFTAAINHAMDRSQALLNQNPRDTAALYALGVAYGLRANFSFLFRKAWIDSLRDATNARKTHARLIAIDPNDVDAHLVQGIHDYVVGSLSWRYRVLGLLAGFRGDKEAGIHTLETVAANGKQNNIDAKIILTAIYRREKQSSNAVPLLDDLIARFPRNPLLRFELAQVYTDLAEKDKALAEIAAIRERKQNGAPGFDRVTEEKIQYVTGNLLFQQRDLDGALEHMQKASAHSTSLDANTRMLCWMRLGQIHDLRGERGQALAAYKVAIDCAPQSELAKESRGYITSPYHRKS
jgi:predicted Zn-dependent protease